MDDNQGMHMSINEDEKIFELNILEDSLMGWIYGTNERMDGWIDWWWMNGWEGTDG